MVRRRQPAASPCLSSHIICLHSVHRPSPLVAPLALSASSGLFFATNADDKPAYRSREIPPPNARLTPSWSHGDIVENAMATYNPGHGAGPAHTGAGPSHGLPMAHNMTNGRVAMDVFDQELNFDDSLL